MDEKAFVDPVAETESPSRRPDVTFMGNTYDLASLGALASGLLLIFMCLTCNMGFYCLPFVPIIMGIIGLATAQQAVDSERTRLWSWVGVGTGVAVFLIIAVAVLGYIGFMIVALASGGTG